MPRLFYFHRLTAWDRAPLHADKFVCHGDNDMIAFDADQAIRVTVVHFHCRFEGLT